MRRISILCLGLSVLFVACRPAQRPDGGRGLLPVGAAAPEVIGTTRDGKSTALSAARGHAAVVYFYPKDETPGCTKEACAFRDAFDRYEAHRVTIFGVSRDSEESHREFRAKHSLPFPLVADGDGSIASAYGVSSTFGMASRVTFLVGPNGTIVRVWPDVDPGVHANEVLAAAESVQSLADAGQATGPATTVPAATPPPVETNPCAPFSDRLAYVPATAGEVCDAARCRGAGGECALVGRVCPSACVRRSTDSGKACKTREDCEGQCLAPANAENGQRVAGKCSPLRWNAGCFKSVSEGVAAEICVD